MSALKDRAHAGPVAFPVREHGEGRCLGIVDDGAAGRHGRGDTRLGRIMRHPHVEVEPLTRCLVGISALEPEQRHTTGGVDDGSGRRRRSTRKT